MNKRFVMFRPVAWAVILFLGSQFCSGADQPESLTLKGISAVPVEFDGNVSKFEYGDATHATFQNGHGNVDVSIKRHGEFLYFAFQIPDLSPNRGDDIVIMLDTKNKRAVAPSAECIRAYVRRKSENSRMDQGDGKGWVNLYGEWEYRSHPYTNGWEVECRIPTSAIPVSAEGDTTVGLAFRIWDNEPQKKWNWPAGSDEEKPSTWGTLILKP